MLSRRRAPSSSGPYWEVPSYDLSPGEIEAVESISGEALRFEHAACLVVDVFGDVESAATDLFTDPRLSPGVGSGSCSCR